MKNLKRFGAWITVVAAICWTYIQQRKDPRTLFTGSPADNDTANPEEDLHAETRAVLVNAAPVNGTYHPGAMNDQTAQRLARLLISEIKLYYMDKLDGQDASDVKNIYDLLKGPIDKSRQHYQRRVGSQAIESMPDYFHGELVRSLCAGDASRLGPNYKPVG